MRKVLTISAPYLMCLIIPLVWLLADFRTPVSAKDDTPQERLLGFSVMLPAEATLYLSADKDTLLIASPAPGAFRHVQVPVQRSDYRTLELSFSGLAAGDSVMLSEISLYSNGQVYKLIPTDNNTGISHTTACHWAAYTVHTTDKALSFLWPDGSVSHPIPLWMRILPLLLCFGLMLLIFFLKPSPGALAIVLTFTLMAMFALHKVCTPPEATLEVRSEDASGTAELFFGNSPFFDGHKKITYPLSEDACTFPLNLRSDPFLRLDWPAGNNSAENVSVAIRSGIFSGELYNKGQAFMANDLICTAQGLVPAGADPYLAFITPSYIRSIASLLWLQENTYFFLTLLICAFLLVAERLTRSFIRRPPKLAASVFVLLPAMYMLLLSFGDPQPSGETKTHVYLSAHTSAPSVVTLFNGGDSLSSWALEGSGYKYLHYRDAVTALTHLRLRFDYLSPGDTINLLSANLYRDGRVTCLSDTAAAGYNTYNAHALAGCNTPSYAAGPEQAPVFVELPYHNTAAHTGTISGTAPLVLLLMAFAFILLLFWAPRPGILVPAVIFTTLLMPVLFWLCNDVQWRIRLQTDPQVRSVQFFYGRHPAFDPNEKYDVNSPDGIFNTQVDIRRFPFLRCDIVDSAVTLNKLNAEIEAGLFSTMLFDSLTPPERLLSNDLMPLNGHWQVTGPDPFIVLSTHAQIRTMQSLSGKRGQLFALLSLALFFVFLLTAARVTPEKLPALMTVLIFATLLSSGFILRLFNAPALLMAAEMRYAQPFPVFQKDSLTQSLNRLENFFNDRVPARSGIIRLNNYAEYLTFGGLADHPQIHFGKEGWLFYVGDNCRENYENRKPLTSDEMERMKEALLIRRDWLRARGSEFYLMLPPMAYFVYEDMVGPRLRRYNKQSKTEQLFDYLRTHTDLHVVDVLPPLLEARKKYNIDLYYRQNSHWNNYGAYVAYRTLMDHIRRDNHDTPPPLALKDIDWVEFDTYSPDLLLHLALEYFFTWKEFKPVCTAMTPHIRGTSPVYEGFNAPAPPFLFENSARENAPTIMLYGDSYAAFLWYYLSTNFKRSIFLFTPLFFPSVFEVEKPDIVVQEMNDYAIYNLLLPNPPLPDAED